MNVPGLVKTPLWTCWQCRHEARLAAPEESTYWSPKGPRAGDWGICICCAAISFISLDLSAHKPTEENWANARPGFRAVVESMRMKVVERIEQLVRSAPTNLPN